MEKLITQYAQSEFDAGDDAGVVAKLNAKTQRKVTSGRISVAGMGDASPEMTAKFLATVKGTITALRGSTATQEQQAQATLFEAFLNRFVNNAEGLDFTNDKLRSNLTAITTQAGWSQVEIDYLLAFGFVLESPAVLAMGREVTLEDVAAYRLVLRKRSLEDAAVDALQLFRERLSSWDGSGDPPVLGAA